MGGTAGFGLGKLFKNKALKFASPIVGSIASGFGGTILGKKIVEKTPYYKKFTELGMKLQEDFNKQSAFKGR